MLQTNLNFSLLETTCNKIIDINVISVMLSSIKCSITLINFNWDDMLFLLTRHVLSIFFLSFFLLHFWIVETLLHISTLLS